MEAVQAALRRAATSSPGHAWTQRAGIASLSALWKSLVSGKDAKAELEAALASHRADTEARLQKLEAHNKFLIKRNAVLTDQIGYLTESTLRQTVRELHGHEAGTSLHVSSLYGLCSLLLPRDAQAMTRDVDLTARQQSLAAACANPDSLLVFLDIFLGRLHEQGSRLFRANLAKAEAQLRQLLPLMAKSGAQLHSKALDTAITCLQRLESLSLDQRSAGSAPEQACAALETPDVELPADEGSSSDEKEVLGGQADGAPGSYAVAWSRPYFAGLIRYLRACKGGPPRLHAHLLQPDSLGLALLSASATQSLFLQFELDGRGTLEVFSDEAVITAFEFKASLAGLGKGKAQLRSRLRMLTWAARHSGAVPASVPVVRGRGYLYLPRSAGVRPQELLEDGGRLTILVSTL